MIHHVTRATRIFIFWSLIFLAVGSTGLRIVLSEVESYKAELELKISDILGVPFKIGKLHAKMRGFNPEIVLKQISISEQGTQQSPIQLREIRLGIDVINVLLKQDLMASSWMTLVGAKLTIMRKQDGSFAVVGLKANDEQPYWLMQGGHYEILDSEVHWQDQLHQAKTQILQHVSIMLKNLDDNQHQFRMHVNLPQKMGKSLTVIADFSGDVFTAGEFTGILYAEGQRVLLSDIFTNEIHSDFQFDSGVSDFQVWSEWDHSKLKNLTGKIKINDGLVSRNSLDSIPLDSMDTEFHWQRDADLWQLDVSRFKLDSGEKKWPEASFSISKKSEKKLVASIKQLDLAQASELVLFSRMLEKSLANQLKRLKLQGIINDTVFYTDFDGSYFAINGFFNHIGFVDASRQIAVKNFSGRIKGSNQQGIVKLRTRDAKLVLPEILSIPLTISQLTGQVLWRQQQNLSFSSDDLAVSLPGLSTRNRFHLELGKQQKDGLIDWQTEVTNGVNVAMINKLYPDKILDKELLSWLQQLLVSGEIAKAKILFYGKTSDYPFINGNGTFQADLTATDLKISYGEQWPKLTGIDGQVFFRNDTLDIRVNKGQLSGESIKSLRVTLPSFRENEILTVKARLEGRIEQTFDFLENSPLSDKLLPVTQVITAKGNNTLDVHLHLPVADVEQTDVKVEASLRRARVSVLPLALEVTKMSGQLIFTEDDVFSKDLKGFGLGFPVTFDVSSDPEKMLINGTGKTDTENLKKQFPNQLWQVASGNLQYDLKLTVPRDGNLPSNLHLHSELLGLTLNLPEELAKSAEQKQPIWVDFTFDDSNVLLANLDYADRLKVAASLDMKKSVLLGLNIVYGAGEPEFLGEDGIVLRVDQERLNLDSWLSLTEKSEHGGALLSLIHLLDLTVDQLVWRKQKLGRVVLKLNKNESHFAGAIKTAFFKGGISFPSDLAKEQKILLKFDDIDFSALSQLFIDQDNIESLAPEDLPLFDLQSEKVFWQQHDLGRLSISAKHDDRGMIFPKIRLISNNSDLSIENGFWKHQQGTNISGFKGQWRVKDLGLFLTSMGLSNDVIDTQALFEFDLQWPDPPYQFALDKLAGTIKMHLEDGRLLGIEPGVGRLLGILNLGNLYRRIRLDFSDVFSQGLSFEHIRGDFVIADGKAKTNNLLVDALPAKIKISGELDLVNRRIDQDIFVLPKSAEVIPIAGKIVGGVVGAIAGTITGKPREGVFFGAHYRLEGEWSNPKVISEPENDGLLRKVWTGITDFPWVNNNKEKIINE